MPESQKPILIVMIAGIGDLIIASRSMRAIRNKFPNNQIHLLTSTEAAVIANNYPYIDQVWAFPIRELRRDKFSFFSILKLIYYLKKIKFESIINLYQVTSFQGAFKMGMLFLCLTAKNKIGHDKKGFGLFINKKVPADTFQNQHFADAMMNIAALSGATSAPKKIEVFWDKNCEKKWAYLFSKETIIAINPGGDRQNKRWRPQKYAHTADYLIEHFHGKIILLGGHGEENIAKIIEQNMRNNAINLSGQLTLNDLVYIISRLTMLVTNDSGPMHIAAAVQTPLVAIFGPENPARLGPYTSTDLYRIIYKKLPSKKKDVSRLDITTPEDVIEKCNELLKTRKKIM